MLIGAGAWDAGTEAVSDHAKCSTVFLGTQTNEFGGLLVVLRVVLGD